MSDSSTKPAENFYLPTSTPVLPDGSEVYQAPRRAEHAVFAKLCMGMARLKNALGEKVKDEHDEAETMGTISRALILLGISSENISEKPIAIDEDEAVQDYKDTMQRLKLAREVFFDLAYALDKEIDHLKTTMQPLCIARGIYHLPDDILSNILEYVSQAVLPEHLSRVCRRFRDIMHRLPEMWASVNTRQPDNIFFNRLARSKGAPLNVEIALGARHCWTPDKIDALIQRAERWRSFNIFFEDRTRSLPLSGDATQKWMSPKLPMLRSLNVSYTKGMNMPDETRGLDRAVFPCAGWDMPNLRSLRCGGILPHHTPSSQLTSCSISLHGPSSYHVVTRTEYVHLSKFLSSSPSLERLLLTLKNIRLEPLEGAATQYLPLELARLRELELSICFHDNDQVSSSDAAPLLKFLNSLRTPELARLKTFFKLDEVDRDNGTRFFFSSILSSRRQCLKLHEFKFDSNLFRGTINFLDIVLDQLPQLKRIKLTGCYNKLVVPSPADWSQDEHAPSSLETLTLGSVTLTHALDLETRALEELVNFFTVSMKKEHPLRWEQTPRALYPEFKKIVYEGRFPRVTKDIASRYVDEEFVDWID